MYSDRAHVHFQMNNYLLVCSLFDCFETAELWFVANTKQNIRFDLNNHL